MPAEALKLREKAYRSFTRHLLARDIRPGQFISQRELVALTGQPLGAIRELIPRLEAEGLIVTVPQRGMQVAHVDLSLIRNAFQFRLHPGARGGRGVHPRCRRRGDRGAARARTGDRRTGARTASTRQLVDDAQDVDRDFHEALIDHLGNDIISKSYRVNWIKVRLIRQNETALS